MLHEETPIQYFFRESERATIRSHQARPYPHVRRGCIGELDHDRSRRPASTTLPRVRKRELSYDERRKRIKKWSDQGRTRDEIRALFDQFVDFVICPECGDHPISGRTHRTSRRIYHPVEQYTEIAQPDFDRAYVYKDDHGDLVCSKCGLILEDKTLIETHQPNENWQKPSNSDFASDYEKFGAYAPIYDGFYYKSKLEASDLENDTVIDEESYSKRSRKDYATIERLRDIALQYCPVTGKSFYGHPLIRTDPNHPRKKEFYCQICRKAHAGEPYADKKCWHYIKLGDTRQLGYSKQAVLTAIAANTGKSKRNIAEYCRTYFKGDNFSDGNVSDIIEDYGRRGMINLVGGGYKNNKVVC